LEPHPAAPRWEVDLGGLVTDHSHVSDPAIEAVGNMSNAAANLLELTNRLLDSRERKEDRRHEGAGERKLLYSNVQMLAAEIANAARVQANYPLTQDNQLALTDALRNTLISFMKLRTLLLMEFPGKKIEKQLDLVIFVANLVLTLSAQLAATQALVWAAEKSHHFALPPGSPGVGVVKADLVKAAADLDKEMASLRRQIEKDLGY